MGLSNGERFNGMINCISEIKNVANLPDNMKSIVAKMWHSVFASTSNGGHWIVGSATSNTITDMDSCNPWTIAVMRHLELRDGYLPESNKFDPLEYLDMANLFERPKDRAIFQCYRICESVVYYLRRYDDEFRKNFEDLDRCVSDLIGESWTFMKNNPDYAKAYVLHEIAKIMYPLMSMYTPDDIVLIMKKHHLHHDIKSMVYDAKLEDLKALHIAMVSSDDPLEERLKFLLTLVTYDHIKNDILNMVKESETLSPYVHLVMNYVVKEKTATTATMYEKHDDALNAYGYEGFKILNDKKFAKINLDSKPVEPSISTEKKPKKVSPKKKLVKAKSNGTTHHQTAGQ